MSSEIAASAWADAQVEKVRDSPAARLELLARTYNGPIGRAPRHLPFRRAAMSFMRWQVSPIYAWSFEDRRVWNPERTTSSVRLLRRVIPVSSR
jgi:hypothetical protein